MKQWCTCLLIGWLGLLVVACTDNTPTATASVTPSAEPATPSPTLTILERASLIQTGDITPPIVSTPCQPDHCLFEDQTVTVIVNKLGFNGALAEELYEIKDEFEAATGAQLEIVEKPLDEHFAVFLTDLTTGSGQFDASIAGAWWLGDLTSQGLIRSYDEFYGDARFPIWEIDDVLVAPRALLEYDGQKFMVANDHDGQVMYYRRDLLESEAHQAAFSAEYGYSLAVPQTWSQFRDVAAYFNGQDLNDDSIPDSGLTLHLKAGQQGMFHFMSFSAPFVIGAENLQHYWFDPDTMQPLIASPGHVRALEALVDLVQFGPTAMLDWDLAQSWDHFLRGEAALTFTWGDLGALAQQQGSVVKGKIGTAHLPGTMRYYNIPQATWVDTNVVNVVGNTSGGSWAGVIARHSDAPEATYYLLALLASPNKSRTYAARGSDGVDLGRYSHFLPPNGSAEIDSYLNAGWDETDIRQYSEAYYNNFSNSLQFPYLRIPGTFGYWSALDIHLFEAVTGQVTPAEALAETVLDFEELTDLLGREQQIEFYRASLNITAQP